jgi:hypothetical protein
MEPYEREPSAVVAKNTSENPINTSAEPKSADPLKDAKAAFRRQVAKPGPRTSARTSGGP